MEPLAIFVLQFMWFLFAWSLIAYFVLWPWSARLSSNARLSVWVAPEMFRILGWGLLVPNLSPGMPTEFAVSTAAGDRIVAALPVENLAACTAHQHVVAHAAEDTAAQRAGHAQKSAASAR